VNIIHVVYINVKGRGESFNALALMKIMGIDV
jgi:hypothetical protein